MPDTFKIGFFHLRAPAKVEIKDGERLWFHLISRSDVFRTLWSNSENLLERILVQSEIEDKIDDEKRGHEGDIWDKNTIRTKYVEQGVMKEPFETSYPALLDNHLHAIWHYPISSALFDIERKGQVAPLMERRLNLALTTCIKEVVEDGERKDTPLATLWAEWVSDGEHKNSWEVVAAIENSVLLVNELKTVLGRPTKTVDQRPLFVPKKLLVDSVLMQIAKIDGELRQLRDMIESVEPTTEPAELATRLFSIYNTTLNP